MTHAELYARALVDLQQAAELRKIGLGRLRHIANDDTASKEVQLKAAQAWARETGNPEPQG